MLRFWQSINSNQTNSEPYPNYEKRNRTIRISAISKVSELAKKILLEEQFRKNSEALAKKMESDKNGLDLIADKIIANLKESA